MPEPTDNRRSWWPAVVVVLAACAFCWPVFAGRIMLPADMCLLMLPWRSLAGQYGFTHPYNPMFDPIQQYLPWRIYAVDSLRTGVIPLWNPYAFLGTPFLANLQSTLLYPLNLLFLVTGARHGFGVSAVIHLILGGLFTYAFLRTLSLRRPAALLGSLVVMFNGFAVTWLEYPTVSLWVFMWLPAILLCYERSLRAPRSIWPILTALAIGLQFLGGHLQVSTYILVAFVIYVIARCLGGLLSKPLHGALPQPPRLRVAILLALIPLALGLALAAGQILPTLELAGQTGRVAHGAKGAIGTAFPVTHLVLYLAPNFFGNPVDYNYWGNYRDPSAFNFFETACYVGILPLFLAAWSLRRWRQPAFWFFALLIGFAVLAATGSPVYSLLYYLAPGFRELAGLGRVLCLAAFGLAGLAALGLDDLLCQTERRQPRAALLFGALAVAVVWGSSLLFEPLVAALDPEWRFAGYQTRQMLYFAILSVAAVALISLRTRTRFPAHWFAASAIALLVLDLFGFGMRFNPYVPASMAYPQTDSTRWLQANAGHSRFTSLASHGLDWMPHNAPMIFGLRDIHGSDSLRVRSSFELVSPPGAGQAEYPPATPPLMSELGVRYLMTRQDLPAPWKLVRNTDAPIYENPNARPRAYLVGAPDRGVSFTRDDPDAIALAVDSDKGGQLILTDSYYPGWRASVDGKPTRIALANNAFRSVAVPAGRHSVEFRYDPATFRVGIFVALIALAVLAGGLAAVLARRPRPLPSS